MTDLQVLAIDASPGGSGRTHTVLRAVLEGASAAGAATRELTLADAPTEGVLSELTRSQAFVFGSPVYRASYAWPLKDLLDRIPRGLWGETEEPIRARAASLVITGASWHHYLAVNELRAVLAGFFAAHVLPPGLYVPGEGFTPDRRLQTAFEELAHAQGVALVELARAVAASPVLRGVRPQA